MLRVCLCEDNIAHSQKIASILFQELDKRNVSYSLHEYHKLNKLDKLLDKDKFRFDLILLDIDFDGKTSIPLAKKINKLYPQCYIIYISNYLDYVKDIFDTSFVYYILKDELEERFPHAIEKTLHQLQIQPKLKIQKKGKIFLLNQGDILYFERDIRVTHIILEDDTLTITEKLESIINRLNPDHFIRCHRSYIVNTSYIQEYSIDSITMKNGYSIPVSRRYRNDLKDFILNDDL